MRSSKKALRVAVCGMIAALALVLMLCTTLIPVGTYVFPCFAGILFVAIVIEFGERWALAAFFAVAVLSFVLAGDKEAAVYFAAFFGYYPTVKSFIEKLNNKVVQWIIKFAVFTAAMVAAFFVSISVLMIPAEEFTLFGFYVPWALLLLGEIWFPVYDILCSRLIATYVIKLRGKIFKTK